MKCGHWKRINGQEFSEEIECSNCKSTLGNDNVERPLYCQFCGSRNEKNEGVKEIILMHNKDTDTFEVYEPYCTIDVMTEEQFLKINRALSLLKADNEPGLTNREVLMRALAYGDDYENLVLLVDYINCPSSSPCLYDGGNDHSMCDECKIKWLQAKWEY